MLTPKQEKWLEQMSDTETVKIIPYNPYSKEIFRIIKNEILKFLNENIEILHRGASSMGISGKGDVDIYVSVSAENFDYYFAKLKDLYGEPGSFYQRERARWTMEIDGIETEVFIMNNESPEWNKSSKLENYLRNNEIALKEYEDLKEKGHGLSYREYYRIKTEFINEILMRLGEPLE